MSNSLNNLISLEDVFKQSLKELEEGKEEGRIEKTFTESQYLKRVLDIISTCKKIIKESNYVIKEQHLDGNDMYVNGALLSVGQIDNTLIIRSDTSDKEVIKEYAATIEEARKNGSINPNRAIILLDKNIKLLRAELDFYDEDDDYLEF